MIKVRRLPVDRWREYRDLRLEALRMEPAAFGSSSQEDEKLTEEQWRKRIQNVTFALSDDKPLGMISCVFSDRVKTGHVADIFGVYVSPDHRGRGVGTKLLKRVLSLARRKGIIKLKLAVNPEQLAAVRLYEKAGFVPVGRMKKELRIGRRFFDEIIMEKLL